MFTLNAGFQKLWQKIKISGFILAEFREVLPSNRGREDRMRPNCSRRVLKDLMGNIKQHPRRINSLLQYVLGRFVSIEWHQSVWTSLRFESFSRATEPLKKNLALLFTEKCLLPHLEYKSQDSYLRIIEIFLFQPGLYSNFYSKSE